MIWAGCSSHNISHIGEHPEFLTLKSLIERYCSYPQVLKVDCEGCEYDFILSAPCDELRKFSHIQIEYHFGYQNLKTKLEQCGFEVTCTRPSFFIPMNKNRMTMLVTDGNLSQTNTMFIGWLYATNKKL